MISKRQLYAMGETFGDSATRTKPGGRIYGGGGSGLVRVALSPKVSPIAYS